MSDLIDQLLGGKLRADADDSHAELRRELATVTAERDRLARVIAELRMMTGSGEGWNDPWFLKATDDDDRALERALAEAERRAGET